MQEREQILEKRLDFLEHAIGSQYDPSKSSQQVISLQDRLLKIEENLQKKTETVMKTINKKMVQVQQFLKKYDSEFTSMVLNTNHKVSILIENENEILQAVKFYNQIEQLKKYINFNPVLDITNKVNELEKYKTMSKLQRDGENLKILEENKTSLGTTFLSQQQNVEQIIKVENQIIQNLNKKFIYLEAMISILEDEQKSKNK